MWGYTIVLFIGIQNILSNIIVRAKWKTLNKIQEQIRELESQGPVLSKETLEHIGKLIDYHDRIRATRNTAFDLRALLNFLNSLILPTISVLLSNGRDLLDLLADIGSFTKK